MRSWAARCLATLLICLLVASTAAAAVFAAEYYLRRTDPEAADFWWRYPEQPTLVSISPFQIVDSHSVVTAIHRNVTQNGVAPWEAKGRAPLDTIYRLSSNELGFFTKHPITAYPPKRAGEYRIIITGGSGAQGHGATTWDRLFYAILEHRLDNALKPLGVDVDVINLAMAGSFAAGNAVILNRFAHPMKPDLILLYNGANDLAQFTQLSYWRDSCESYYSAFLRASYEYPPALRPWAGRLPYLFNVYGYGPWLKSLFFSEYYWTKAVARCWKDNGYSPASDGSFDSRTTFDQVSYPSFVRSVKSIKRDFCGIPIVWALQAIHTGENALYEKWIRPGIYDEFFRRGVSDLDGYYNRDWTFIDANRLAREPERTAVPGYVDTSLAVHLDDAGHRIIGNLLADHLTPIVRASLAHSRARAELCQ